MSEIACPAAKIVNVYELEHTDDLSPEFGLSSIRISFTKVAPNEKKIFRVQSGITHFNFLVKGDGELDFGSTTDALNEWDCFGLLPLANDKEYTITAGNQGTEILIFADRNSRTKTEDHGPSFPTIIHSRSVTEPFGKGRLFGYIGQLTNLSDIKKQDSPNAWNVNLEIVPPGAKTSEAHCHSHEEEFAFILNGTARYWHHGQVPSPTLNAGDFVGWKPGTGIAHCLINDGVAQNEQGDAFSYLIFGEHKPSVDKWFYPDRDINQVPESRRWKNRPNVPWGGASKEPEYPRPDDLAEK